MAETIPPPAGYFDVVLEEMARFTLEPETWPVFLTWTERLLGRPLTASERESVRHDAETAKALCWASAGIFVRSLTDA